MRFRLYEGRRIVPHTKAEMNRLSTNVPDNMSEEIEEPETSLKERVFPTVCLLEIRGIGRIRFVFDAQAGEYIFIDGDSKVFTGEPSIFDSYWSRIEDDRLKYVLYLSDYPKDLGLDIINSDDLRMPYSISVGYIEVTGSVGSPTTLRLVSCKASIEGQIISTDICSKVQEAAVSRRHANLYCLFNTARQIIPSFLEQLYTSAGINLIGGEA